MDDYIEWTGTVKLPKGPWAETHEFTGEVRRCVANEHMLVNANVRRASYATEFEYPVLRPKRPKWQPPAHLVGTGWKMRCSSVTGVLQVSFYDDDKWVAVVDEDGYVTRFGQAMQLDPNNLPDLELGEEIVL